MVSHSFDDFTQITALWQDIARRNRARAEAEPQVFNQLTLALAARLPQRPDPALCEAHALAAAIAGRGFLPADAKAPITGHLPHDRVALTAESFQRLSLACQAAL